MGTETSRTPNLRSGSSFPNIRSERVKVNQPSPSIGGVRADNWLPAFGPVK